MQEEDGIVVGTACDARIKGKGQFFLLQPCVQGFDVLRLETDMMNAAARMVDEEGGKRRAFAERL